MTLLELYNILERQIILCEESKYDPNTIKVKVPITTITSIGGTPCVDVNRANIGFDWDNGKFMIYPDKSLSLTDNDQLEKMRKEAEQIGWNGYNIRNLKAEIKKLRTEITTLKEICNRLG